MNKQARFVNNMLKERIRASKKDVFNPGLIETTPWADVITRALIDNLIHLSQSNGVRSRHKNDFLT